MAGASRVTVAATGATTTILIARLLGPDGSGTYALAQSIMLILIVATTLGVEHGITYFVSRGQWGPRQAYAAAIRVALTMGVVGAAVALALRLLVPSAFGGLSVGLTCAVLAALPCALFAYYIPSVALSVDRYEAYVLPPALQSALAFVLAATGAIAVGISGAVLGLAASYVIVGLGSVIWGRRLPDGARGGDRMLRQAIGFGIKGYAANALQILNYRLDLFILSAVAATADVGHYSVAISVTSLLQLAPGAISEVLFPRVAHLSHHDDEAAQAQRTMVELKALRHVTLATALLAVALAIGLVLLVVPVYGPEFQAAIGLGLILLPGVGIAGIGVTLAAIVVGRGRPSYSLYSVLITTPITIALYVIAIPWLGAVGAALATTLSYLATSVLLGYWYRRLTGRALLWSLLPTRSEWHDLLNVRHAAFAWLRTRRGR